MTRIMSRKEDVLRQTKFFKQIFKMLSVVIIDIINFDVEIAKKKQVNT